MTLKHFTEKELRGHHDWVMVRHLREIQRRQQAG